MIKKQVYPKTKRVQLKEHITITEKLDGSNLCIAKFNGELLICQRRYIFFENELDECKKQLYKGLYQWLIEHKDYLKEHLRENAVICGEWLGMGKLKYNFDNRFFMFAKANIDERLELYNIYHEHELFIYPFDDCIIPDFISLVPVVVEEGDSNINYLNALYDAYKTNVCRNVEGFVLNYGQDNIKKYVRMKNGKLEEHKE